MKLIIDIPEEDYKIMKHNIAINNPLCPLSQEEMVFKVAKGKPLEQEPCDDAISRKWLKTAIHNFYYGLKHTPTEDDIQAYINAAPFVNPQPKTGHWIDAKVGKMFPSNDYKCSECGNILDFDGVNCGRGDANFCPNCGARMEKE